MSGLQISSSDVKDSPSRDGTRKVRQSRNRDSLIKLRESVLDLITGTGSQVLNEFENLSIEKEDHGLGITAELKRYMDMAKASAMDEQGYFVDYDLLEGSKPYLEYRQKCSPRLRYFRPETLLTREERLAFWINLYNALVMDGIIAKEVKQSVGSSSLRLLTFFREIAYNVGGERMSADDIEHGVLRGNRGHPMLPGPHFTSTDARHEWVVDPVDFRIHFALNCAGRSCPPIQVYAAEELEVQLELAARSFVNSDLDIDRQNNAVLLSSIFKWFEADFGGTRGVVDFLVEHLPIGKRKNWLAENSFKDVSFKYKPYDWGLNSFELGLAE